MQSTCLVIRTEDYEMYVHTVYIYLLLSCTPVKNKQLSLPSHICLSISDKNRSTYFICYSYRTWDDYRLELRTRYLLYLSSPRSPPRAHKQHKTTVTLLTYGRRVNPLRVAAIKSRICRLTRPDDFLSRLECTLARGHELPSRTSDVPPARGVLSLASPLFTSYLW